MLDPRGQLLRAAVGFAGCSMPSYDRALHALRSWLDSWSGVGRIAVGMHRQGFDLQLTQYDDRGWRATFYTTGMEHSYEVMGPAWERIAQYGPGRGTHCDGPAAMARQCPEKKFRASARGHRTAGH